jgi:cytochrome c oxidase subunit IV
MASKAHGHGHDDGAVHAHVSSAFFYGAIFAALLTLTVLTVGQSYIDLGRLNIAIVILIATMKASLVVTFFMHLRWDNKFNALVFISCIFFIGVFFAYTMNDTERRGEFDPDQNVGVLPKTGENAPGGYQGHAAEPAGSAAGSGHAPAPGTPAPGGAAPGAAPGHH